MSSLCYRILGLHIWYDYAIMERFHCVDYSWLRNRYGVLGILTVWYDCTILFICFNPNVLLQGKQIDTIIL